MVNGPHPIFVQPDALRAPEVILAMNWDTSVDIWNLGCLVSTEPILPIASSCTFI